MALVSLPNDSQERRKAVGLIVLAVMMIGGGVMACIFTNIVAESALEYMVSLGHHYYTYTDNFWWWGVGYIIAGITSLCAGATGSRAAHITNVVLTVITLIIYGIWSIALLAASSRIQIIEDTEHTECSLSSSCKRMTSFMAALTAVVVTTWVLTLAANIVSCTKTCCQSPTQGAVILNHGPTTTIVSSTHTSQPYIAPQGMHNAVGFAPQAPGYAPQAPGYAPQAPGYAPQAAGYAPQDAGNAPPAYTTSNKADLVKAAY